MDTQEVNTEAPIICLCQPAYAQVEPGARDALFEGVAPGHNLKVIRMSSGGSLIPQSFTLPFMQAVLENMRYFAMLHSDVLPEPGWLSKLWYELHRVQADVLSVAIPIKTPPLIRCTTCKRKWLKEPYCLCGGRQKEATFETSTAIQKPGDWDYTRVALAEARALGTFSEYEGEPILVNTGCWLAKLPEFPGLKEGETVPQWLERTPESEWPWSVNVKFEITCDVDYKAANIRINPEDWLFSKYLHSKGAKPFATTAVKVAHRGPHDWRNW